MTGAEYSSARATANSANRAAHDIDPSLKGLQVHEITPVKFGGDPADLSNKIGVTQAEHAPMTKFWNSLQKWVEEMNGK